MKRDLGNKPEALKSNFLLLAILEQDARQIKENPLIYEISRIN